MTRWLPLLLATVLAGCASPPPPAPPLAAETVRQLTADERFAPPSGPVDSADLFDLSPAMRQFLNAPEFKHAVEQKGKERALAEALYRNDALQLTYDTTVSRNAADTFALRSGNCLSLVIMTAAFAKALDMQVTYNNVLIGDNWSRSNGLYLANLHVNITLAHKRAVSEALSLASPLLIDFVAPEEVMGFRSRTVTEPTIVAMYLNNRAAEELAAGHVDDAYWWARAAVLTHPDFVPAFNTLGVVYEQRQLGARAEQLYRLALAREPDNLSIMYNLMANLQRQGRHAEAAALDARIKARAGERPYYYFDRGMEALQAGRFDQARTLFQTEVDRAPYSDEFHFWLGIAKLRLGDVSGAQREIVLAKDNSPTEAARSTYSAKLALLRAGPRSGQ